MKSDGLNLALLFVCCFLSESTAEFEVHTPLQSVVAVHGRPAELQCLYSLSPESPLDRLVLTWQRVDNAQVVHSFYYGKDQLDRQNEWYRGRTSLYISELLHGNASLRLDPVWQNDTAEYLCSVTNLKGTGKATVNLDFAAYYTEPHLSIKVRSKSTTFLYESQGFPQPKIQWLNLDGQNISHQTDICQHPTESQLLLLRSQIEVDLRQGVNYTFIMKNPVLNQLIMRTVKLRKGKLLNFIV
ncbi:CD276 protein, partial [Amia calva]|nr:CD276 protein [Amia calva]